MAPHLQVRATPKPAEATPAKPAGPSRQLRVAPPAARRSVGDIGTMLALSLFVVFLALAVLHAVLVENQAALDELIDLNRLRQEQIDQFQAEIAYLDSPEGVADHALSAGLVPAAELITLAPVGSGLLPPPAADPFGLAGMTPLPTDPFGPAGTAPGAGASSVGESAE